MLQILKLMNGIFVLIIWLNGNNVETEKDLLCIDVTTINIITFIASLTSKLIIDSASHYANIDVLSLAAGSLIIYFFI